MATLPAEIAENAPAKPPRSRRYIPLALRIFLGLLVITALGSGWFVLRGYRQLAAIREIDAWDLRLEPGNPWADASGYVRYPDVDPVTEQVDAMDAVRSYEANIAAVEATKSMFASAIQLLA